MSRRNRKSAVRKQSWNSSNIGKKGISLKCKNRNCENIVHDCSPETVEVLCSICTCKLAPIEKIVKEDKGFLRGWKLMKEFVHIDGTVYHFGEEQPELKGTLSPTDVKFIKNKQKEDRQKNKKLKEIKKQKKEQKLINQYKVGQKERAKKIKDKKINKNKLKEHVNEF